MQEAKVGFNPVDDVILKPSALGRRWSEHPKSAMRRARELGVPQLKFNARSIGYRLSDILKAEAQVTVETN
jgi:hypothetical protein